MTGLTQFGAKCRDHRIRHDRRLHEQAHSLLLKPSEISAIELGETRIPEGYPTSFGAWLGLSAKEQAELDALASSKSNVVAFRPKDQGATDAHKLFRKINKLSPTEIRGIGKTLKGKKTDDG